MTHRRPLHPLCLFVGLCALLMISGGLSPLRAEAPPNIMVPPRADSYVLAIETLRVATGDQPISGYDIETTRKEMSEYLGRLCDLSGYFQILPPLSHIEKVESSGITSETIDFKLWSVLAADYLVKGQARYEAGQLVAEFRLFEVSTGRFTTGRQYRGDPAQWRSIVQRFANQILEAISGVPGVFDTKILFERQEKLGDGKWGKAGIYLRDMDGGANPILVVKDSASHCKSPAWSPDGESISYFCYSEPRALVIRQLVSGAERSVHFSSSQQVLGGIWSPDGRTIAVTVSEHGYSDILLVDAQSLTVKGSVAKSWSNEFNPSFTPDMKRLVFVSERSGQPQIYSANLDGTDLRRLTFEGRFNVAPSVSPDGKRIAYVHEENERSDTRADRALAVYIMDIDGSRQRRMTPDTGHNEDPTWSPDGRYVVFKSDRAGEDSLFIMAADVPMKATAVGDVRLGVREGQPAWGPSLKR